MDKYLPEIYVEQGESIAMFGTCAFTHNRTGKQARMSMAALWRFEGDKAVALREVFDIAAAMSAAS